MSDQDIANALRELADELEVESDEGLPDGWTDGPEVLGDTFAPYKNIDGCEGLSLWVDCEGDVWLTWDGHSYCINYSIRNMIETAREEAQEHFNDE